MSCDGDGVFIIRLFPEVERLRSLPWAGSDDFPCLKRSIGVFPTLDDIVTLLSQDLLLAFDLSSLELLQPTGLATVDLGRLLISGDSDDFNLSSFDFEVNSLICLLGLGTYVFMSVFLLGLA